MQWSVEHVAYELLHFIRSSDNVCIHYTYYVVTTSFLFFSKDSIMFKFTVCVTVLARANLCAPYIIIVMNKFITPKGRIKLQALIEKQYVKSKYTNTLSYCK
jgi:hypothetical protein